MSQFSCPVVTVKTVTKHPDADRLDILTFEEMGWVCVEVRDKRKVGDKVVYIPIDAMVDCTRPEFEFLKKNAKMRNVHIGMITEHVGGDPIPRPVFALRPIARIKTIKLRGAISQGFVIDVPEACRDAVSPEMSSDVSVFLNVSKYEPPAEAVFSANAKGSFPSWCPKTDAERYQNINRNLEPFVDTKLMATSKLDGTSLTVFYDKLRVGDEGGVCSRNQELRPPEEVPGEETPYGFKIDTYWKVVRQFNLLQKADIIAREFSYDRVAIQLELCGPGIQKNRLGLADHEPFAFDIYYEQNGVGHYLDYALFLEVTLFNHIQIVPVIGETTLRNLGDPPDFNRYWNLRYKYSQHRIEGVVCTSLIEQYAGPKLPRIRFKSVNPYYLLETEKDESTA